MATLTDAGAAAKIADTAELFEADRLAASATFDPSAFYRTFRAAKTQVDGATIHYLTGGSGPVILLLHGWPATGPTGAASCPLWPRTIRSSP